MNTPEYAMRTWDDEPLRAAVEKATGAPLTPIEFVPRPEAMGDPNYITPVTRSVFRRVGDAGIRGVCDDCVWEDHCRLCDCCCEPGTP